MIVSNPQGALVFTDDAFDGLAAVVKPISLAKPNWFKKVQTDGRQLRVGKVPYDNIQLGLSGIPDFDFLMIMMMMMIVMMMMIYWKTSGECIGLWLKCTSRV